VIQQFQRFKPRELHLTHNNMSVYMQMQVADAQPEWRGKYVAFPAQAGNFDLTKPQPSPSLALHGKRNVSLQDRMKAFGGDRSPVFYDEPLQEAKVIHFPADPEYRLLQHHYGTEMIPWSACIHHALRCYRTFSILWL
jgi:hypothetical protein